VLLLLALAGCIDGVTQVAGVGAVYTTRCSAEMEIHGVELEARCQPPTCSEHFSSAAVNQVVVAVDPGSKVFGYAERVCLQDLSNASRLFQPPMEEEPTRPAPAASTEPATPGKATE
jgi:hypothetical protein